MEVICVGCSEKFEELESDFIELYTKDSEAMCDKCFKEILKHVKVTLLYDLPNASS